MTSRNIARVPRRSREWAIFTTGTAGTSATDGVSISFTVLAEWLTERGLTRTAGLTISEIHGSVQLTPAAGETSNYIGEAAAGIGFFPDTISGAEDFPNPRTESASWQSHQFADQHFEAPDTAGALITPTNTPQMRLDMHTKSMRKQPNVRSTLRLVVNQTNSSAQSLVCTAQLRMLIILP